MSASLEQCPREVETNDVTRETTSFARVDSQPVPLLKRGVLQWQFENAVVFLQTRCYRPAKTEA